MRALLALSLLVLVLAPAAGAKGRMTLTLGDATPAVGQKLSVLLRMQAAGTPAKALVVAVAPNEGWYDVVGTVTGASSSAHANIPHDGFGVELRHVGGDRWRAHVSFPRRGNWQLVVPNWGGAPGFAIPPPITRIVKVGV